MKRLCIILALLCNLSCQTEDDVLTPEQNPEISFEGAVNEVKFEKGYLIFKDQNHFDIVLHGLSDKNTGFSFEKQFEKFQSFKSVLETYGDKEIELLVGRLALAEKSDLFLLVNEPDGGKSLECQIGYEPLRKITNSNGLVKIGGSIIKLTYDKVLDFGDDTSKNPQNILEINNHEYSDSKGARSILGSYSDTKSYGHQGKNYRFKSKVEFKDYYFPGGYGRTYLSFEVKHQKRHVGFIWAQFDTTSVKVEGQVFRLDDNSWQNVYSQNTNSSSAEDYFGSFCNKYYVFNEQVTICDGVYGTSNSTHGGVGLNGTPYTISH